MTWVCKALGDPQGECGDVHRRFCLSKARCSEERVLLWPGHPSPWVEMSLLRCPSHAFTGTKFS